MKSSLYQWLHCLLHSPLLMNKRIWLLPLREVRPCWYPYQPVNSSTVNILGMYCVQSLSLSLLLVLTFSTLECCSPESLSFLPTLKPIWKSPNSNVTRIEHLHKNQPTPMRLPLRILQCIINILPLQVSVLAVIPGQNKILMMWRAKVQRERVREEEANNQKQKEKNRTLWSETLRYNFYPFCAIFEMLFLLAPFVNFFLSHSYYLENNYQ